MVKVNPGYYAIIPAVVRYDSDLNASAKLMYGEITALANSTGECTAGNPYFAKLYGVHTNTVSDWIRQLLEKGYITSVVDRAAGNKRKIRIAITKNSDTSPEKAEDPYHEKPEDNNTRINNNSNITKTEKVEQESDGLLRKQRDAVYHLYLMRFKVRDGVDLEGAKARYRLTPGRREAIDRRLKDAGYQMVCAAIIGYASEEWTHLGKGNRPDWAADLEKYILRKYEIVEEGANKYEQQRKDGFRGTGAAADEWAHLS